MYNVCNGLVSMQVDDLAVLAVQTAASNDPFDMRFKRYPDIYLPDLTVYTDYRWYVYSMMMMMMMTVHGIYTYLSDRLFV